MRSSKDRHTRTLMTRLSLLFVLGVMSCLLSSNVAHAQSASALRRYGPYPLVGQGLRRLVADLRSQKASMRRNVASCRRVAFAKKGKFCDLDHDLLPNGIELRLGLSARRRDTDNDRLSDRDEIIKYHTNPLKADTDGDGVSDGQEVLVDHTNPLRRTTGAAGDCNHPKFDGAGNTVAFGIPAGIVGNIGRGQQIFSGNCKVCHGQAEPGANLTHAELKTRISQAPMFIARFGDASLADLVAYLHRAEATPSVDCLNPSVPTPTPEPGATATPAPTPTSIAVGCANSFFDAAGNTTQFGIPNPFIGNIALGQSYMNLACTGCHTERGTNFTFAQIKAAVTGPLMNNRSVSDQQFAHLTAFLNRSSAAQHCSNPPPTPTPLDDVSAGTLVFQGICQGCHTNPHELRRLSQGDLNEALTGVRQMSGVHLTAEQKRVLLIYLARV